MPNLETKSEPRSRSLNSKEPMENLRICYIGGGSVGWAHVLMGDLANTSEMNGEVRLYDLKQERAALNAPRV